MQPEGTRVRRKDRRKAWRGLPRGRRATHQAETAYGRQQRERDRLAAWQAAREAAELEEESMV